MKHDTVKNMLRDMNNKHRERYGEYPKRMFLNVIEAKGLIQEEKLQRACPETNWEGWLNGKDVDAWYCNDDRVMIKLMVRK